METQSTSSSDDLAEVDLFASEALTHCPLWFSWTKKSNLLGQNVLAHTWPDLLFPQPSNSTSSPQDISKALRDAFSGTELTREAMVPNVMQASTILNCMPNPRGLGIQGQQPYVTSRNKVSFDKKYPQHLWQH